MKKKNTHPDPIYEKLLTVHGEKKNPEQQQKNNQNDIWKKKDRRGNIRTR